MSIHQTWNNDTRAYYAELEQRENEILDIPDNILYVVPCYNLIEPRIIFKTKDGLVIENKGKKYISLENDVELRNEKLLFTNNIFSNKNIPQDYFYTRENITTKEYKYLGKDIIFDFSKFNKETKKYISSRRKIWFRNLPCWILFFIIRCGNTSKPFTL
jgi:hypothetical protein